MGGDLYFRDFNTYVMFFVFLIFLGGGKNLIL